MGPFKPLIKKSRFILFNKKKTKTSPFKGEGRGSATHLATLLKLWKENFPHWNGLFAILEIENYYWRPKLKSILISYKNSKFHTHPIFKRFEKKSENDVTSKATAAATPNYATRHILLITHFPSINQITLHGFFPSFFFNPQPGNTKKVSHPCGVGKLVKQVDDTWEQYELLP